MNAQVVTVSSGGAQLQAPSPVDLPARITGCNGTAVTLDAGSLYDTYLWSTGDTTPSISVSSAGVYSVTVTDMHGNSSTDAVQVDFDLNFTPTIYHLDMGNNTFMFWTGATPGANAWTWDFGDGYGSNNAVATHTFTGGGPYNICVWVTNPCHTGSTCMQLEAWNTNNDAAANKRGATQDQLTKVDIIPYPNPSTNGRFVVRGIQKNQKFRITDITGVPVLDFEPAPDQYGEIELDLSDLNNGVYILSAIGDSESKHTRLVVSKN